MKITAYLIFFSLLIISACQPTVSLEDIRLHSPQNQSSQRMQSVLHDSCTVIVFYSPDCPLSENYTLTINNLKTKYHKRSTNFIGIVSGESYSNEEILDFIRKYKIQFNFFKEPTGDLATLMNASITPECFVLNENKKVIYHGAIDNWAIDLGKKRIRTTEHYLDAAIQHVLNNKKLNTNFVEAVGCYIE